MLRLRTTDAARRAGIDAALSGPWQEHAVAIARALVDAGYSPDERALGAALGDRRTSLYSRSDARHANDSERTLAASALTAAIAGGDALGASLLRALVDYYDSTTAIPPMLPAPPMPPMLPLLVDDSDDGDDDGDDDYGGNV